MYKTAIPNGAPMLDNALVHTYITKSRQHQKESHSQDV